jgi:hypothetical protein
VPTEEEKVASAKKAKQKAFHEELIGQFSTLVTSGFGVVVALAWNDAIQNFVKEYVEPRIPGSGLISQFLYAILITILIVFITFYLSRLSAHFQSKK